MITEKEKSNFFKNCQFDLVCRRMNLWPITDDWIKEPIKQLEEKSGEKISPDDFAKLAVMLATYSQSERSRRP